MDKSRGIVLALAIAAAIISTALPCPADEKGKDEQSIFTEGDRERERPRRGRGRFELTEEETDRVLEGLKKRDPEKAKELAELRKKDPEKFRAELREHAREEFGEVVRERIEKWRRQRRADFLKWLEKAVPDEAKELARLKERGPDLYAKKYELVWRRYDRIFEESRRNPEWAEILLEDVKLQKRRDDLVKRIKATQNTKERDRLVAALEDVVALRYDVIIRQKQMIYERLLGRLRELQERIKESRTEIAEYMKEEAKAENVKKRTQELLEAKKGLRWD